MADLTMRTARTSIEQGIVNAINLAYGIRYPAVADVSTLRSVPSKAAIPNSLRYVVSKGVCYQWQRFATGADDGDLIILPTDITAGNGRWVKTASSISGGYLKQVQIYNDQATTEQLLERLLGQRPSALVVWTSTNNQPKSIVRGALYWEQLRFDVWVFCTSLRESAEAVEGSALPLDAAGLAIPLSGPLGGQRNTKDPGVNAIIGDIKAVLAGSTLGVTGVANVEIGDETPLLVDLSQRTVVQKLSIVVNATVHLPDTDSVLLGDLYMQKQIATANGSNGGSDYVSSGLTVPSGASLTQTIAAGTAYVGTAPVSVLATPNTFPANSYTYRDLSSSGTWTFVSVNPGQDVPDVTSGCLRVGVTATDGSGVTGDRIIANALINYGAVDQLF